MVSRTRQGWRFDLLRPGAERAWLAGDFNQWSTLSLPMEQIARGHFRITLHLPPGTYRFRYFVDGAWMVDYAAFGLERNPLGQWDSVIYVPPMPDDSSSPSRASTSTQPAASRT